MKMSKDNSRKRHEVEMEKTQAKKNIGKPAKYIEYKSKRNSRAEGRKTCKFIWYFTQS